jgi:uncharacterized protein (TIGR00645 family)
MSDKKNPIEAVLEKFLFSSRWLLAPFYAGLVLALVALLVKFTQEALHITKVIFSSSEYDIILATLALVDLTFIASLVVIVIFSGYENFVSRIEEGDHKDWPEWMGKIDFSGLKLKLMSSIVAISAIQLLKAFMNVKNISDRELYWLVGVHIVFVVSGLIMALTERMTEHGKAGGKGH